MARSSKVQIVITSRLGRVQLFAAPVSVTTDFAKLLRTPLGTCQMSFDPPCSVQPRHNVMVVSVKQAKKAEKILGPSRYQGAVCRTEDTGTIRSSVQADTKGQPAEQKIPAREDPWGPWQKIPKKGRKGL